MHESVECAFRILNAKFKIFEGLICCKGETVNSIIKPSALLHKFIRTWERLFYEGTKKYAVNQLSHHILNKENDDGRQRLLRAQHPRNRLADNSLMAGVIPSQWSYIN